MNDNSGLNVYVILQTQSIHLNWITMTNTGLKVIYKYNKYTTRKCNAIGKGQVWRMLRNGTFWLYNRNEREWSLPMVEGNRDSI